MEAAGWAGVSDPPLTLVRGRSGGQGVRGRSGNGVIHD